MHGDGSTPILRNNCESYLQMCKIKGALLISRYTAGQDMDEEISSSAPSLRWCSPRSYSRCHHSNSATMMMHISYFIYMYLIPHLNIMITVHSDIDGLAIGFF